jgi:hypothetical protein
VTEPAHEPLERGVLLIELSSEPSQADRELGIGGDRSFELAFAFRLHLVGDRL